MSVVGCGWMMDDGAKGFRLHTPRTACRVCHRVCQLSSLKGWRAQGLKTQNSKLKKTTFESPPKLHGHSNSKLKTQKCCPVEVTWPHGLTFEGKACKMQHLLSEKLEKELMPYMNWNCHNTKAISNDKVGTETKVINHSYDCSCCCRICSNWWRLQTD